MIEWLGILGAFGGSVQDIRLKGPNVTFRCFCQKCDTKTLFVDIDGGIKDKKSFLNQIYRSACSLYFRILEQAIKMCYIAGLGCITKQSVVGYNVSRTIYRRETDS